MNANLDLLTGTHWVIHHTSETSYFTLTLGGEYDGQGLYCALSIAYEVFLFLLPNYIHVHANMMQEFLYLENQEVLKQEYSQPRILPLLTSGG